MYTMENLERKNLIYDYTIIAICNLIVVCFYIVVKTIYLFFGIFHSSVYWIPVSLSVIAFFGFAINLSLWHLIFNKCEKLSVIPFINFYLNCFCAVVFFLLATFETFVFFFEG